VRFSWPGTSFAIEESVVDYVITSRNDEGKVIGSTGGGDSNRISYLSSKSVEVGGIDDTPGGLRPYANSTAVQSAGMGDGR